MGIDFKVYKQEFKIIDKAEYITLKEVGSTYDRSLANEIEQRFDELMSNMNGSTFEILGSNLIPYLKELNINKEDIDVDEWYRVIYYY